MKTLFFSTKDYEHSYLESAREEIEVAFIKEALSLQTVSKAEGYEAISIFTGDDASHDVIVALHKYGVRFIAIRAAGYDNVDLDMAHQLGIRVANVPDYSPHAIAEHAVALLLALNRKLLLADRQVHQHNFSTTNLIGFDMHNKTVGIIGVGKIGSVFAKIMHGFGCRIIAYDIHENAELKELYGLEYMDLPSLCREARIISLHTCLTPATKHLINKKLIGLMQRGVMLINTSRGGCVNTTDILEGLESGQVGYYGADVYEYEKGIFFYDHSEQELRDELLNKLLAMSNVLITPHQAFATEEALTNIAVGTFTNINCWQQNKYNKNEIVNEMKKEKEKIQ